ncbi:putative toxin-antitoxin system toxin component, PIN family [Thiocystis violacea]|uniref:putative toxin-antitoxin system toxin component, PIN family n=1 Tax=Thiocystis violacea TaxID=13725 RepID=UPI001906223B|nr:putative toxin-antitoxin system toxin component, PIN family [Thiocystis violacea]MBK1723111.1 putative toxin-antitoxin system toxin component, PIN family [Thiocystis violacea]
MAYRIVVDTNVLTAALISPDGPNRAILRGCLLGAYKPLLSNALFSEYEDVTARPAILERCPVAPEDVKVLLEAVCSVAEWVPIFYLWRPNLTDEGDNHVLELAAAGNARVIVTNNIRDFSKGELRFPDIQIVTPTDMLREV